MKTKLLAALILATLSAPALAQSPERFAAAKKLLAGIHEEVGHLRTLLLRMPLRAHDAVRRRHRPRGLRPRRAQE